MKGMLFARKSFSLHGANHPKIWPSPPHKLHVPYYFSKKKHCFCNFHAVFGDFGQNVHAPRDPLRETLGGRTKTFHRQFTI